MVKDKYFEMRMKQEEEHYDKLHKKLFGIKGIFLGIITLGFYQTNLIVGELRRVGLL